MTQPNLNPAVAAHFGFPETIVVQTTSKIVYQVESTNARDRLGTFSGYILWATTNTVNRAWVTSGTEAWDESSKLSTR